MKKTKQIILTRKYKLKERTNSDFLTSISLVFVNIFLCMIRLFIELDNEENGLKWFLIFCGFLIATILFTSYKIEKTVFIDEVS